MADFSLFRRASGFHFSLRNCHDEAVAEMRKAENLSPSSADIAATASYIYSCSGLADEAVTLAEVLQDAGYATYGVQTNGWLHQSFGFHQGFDRYMFPKSGGDRRLGKASLWPHADRVVEEAERLIEAHDRTKPFFLYLHFMDVHEYAAPPHLKTFGSDSKGAYLAAIRWVDDAIERVREQLDQAAGPAQRRPRVAPNVAAW